MIQEDFKHRNTPH